MYASCQQLTSLNLSNNFMLRPEALLPLLQPPQPQPDAGGGASASHTMAGVAESALQCCQQLHLQQHAGEGEEGVPRAGLLLQPEGLQPRLTQLRRQWAEGQEGPAAAAAAAPTPLPLLPCLRTLDVGYCSLPSATLAQVVTRARHLHTLSISGGGVTDSLWPLLHFRPGCGFDNCGGGGAGGGGGPHQLRSLFAVGGLELRQFCLGLAPEAAARQHGLLVEG